MVEIVSAPDALIAPPELLSVSTAKMTSPADPLVVKVIPLATLISLLAKSLIWPAAAVVVKFALVLIEPP